MSIRFVRSISVLLITLLSACSPMGTAIPGLAGAVPGVGAVSPFGTPNPAGALFGASQDCDGMALVLADPAQPAFLKDQVRQAMAAGGCL